MLVIPKATRAEVVGSSLNSSKLWDLCQVFLLNQNMRPHPGNSALRNHIISEFSKWQLAIGDGKLESIRDGDGQPDILFEIPEQYIVNVKNENPVKTLFDITYPEFTKNMFSHEYLRSRAILTPTNALVDDINYSILEKIPAMTHSCFSHDSIDDNGGEDNDFDSSFPVEYHNSINMSCLPKHESKIKVGAIVMLIRNLNQILRLCNGTRMIVIGCKKKIV